MNNITTPLKALKKAKKEGPSDKTRNMVLSNPFYAYRYALKIDKRPMDKTRNAILKRPDFSYKYAIYLDKRPRNNTRNAVLKRPYYTYYYALFVHKQPKIITRKAVAFYIHDVLAEYNYKLNFFLSYTKYIDKKYISFILI